MHPPFVFTDHRVGPFHHQPTPKVRRSQPEVLRLTPAGPGWPAVPLVAGTAPAQLPSGHAVQQPVFLQVVPPARNTLRDAFGRFLIRTGQRMILSNRPG